MSERCSEKLLKVVFFWHFDQYWWWTAKFNFSSKISWYYLKRTNFRLHNRTFMLLFHLSHLENCNVMLQWLFCIKDALENGKSRCPNNFWLHCTCCILIYMYWIVDTHSSVYPCYTPPHPCLASHPQNIVHCPATPLHVLYTCAIVRNVTHLLQLSHTCCRRTPWARDY